MNKSMYSLMLMDEVVKAVDRHAYLRNTNRSNLVNQILAEYLNVETPEMVTREVFGLISELIDSEIFQIAKTTSDTILSIKSSLEYKYRPTIKYNFELYRTYEEGVGQLTVTFRTQSPKLLVDLAQFFKYWIAMEEQYSNCAMQYQANLGKFVRIVKLDGDFSSKDISEAISNYILMFDEVLKRYLTKQYSTYKDIAEDYTELRNYYHLNI